MPIKTASPQDTFDHVFGSGATSYSWWLDIEITNADTPEWSARVRVEDGNDSTVTKTVDHATVLAAARKVIKRAPMYSSTALVRECKNLIFDADNTDFDANSADELLQFIVLGEIVFG